MGWVDSLDHGGNEDEVDEIQEDNNDPVDDEVLAGNVAHPDSEGDEQHQGKEHPVAGCMVAESTPLDLGEQIGTHNVASKERCGSKVHMVGCVQEPF